MTLELPNRKDRLELDRLQRIVLDPGGVTQDELDDLLEECYLDEEPCSTCCGRGGCPECPDCYPGEAMGDEGHR